MFWVIQFEDGVIVGATRHATAASAAAGFRAEVQGARARGFVFGAPDVMDGFAYIRELEGGDKTVAFALVGAPCGEI